MRKTKSQQQLKSWTHSKSERNLTNVPKSGRKWTKISKEKLKKCLNSLFVWSVVDMPGIDWNFVCHKLSIFFEDKLVAYRRRKLNEEKKRVVQEEYEKLIKARFIKEVKYSTWHADMAMVKKSNGKWRMSWLHKSKQR